MLESQATTGRMGTLTAINDMITRAYEEHAAVVHGITLRSTRDPEVAADVTQEAFIRLLAEAQAGRFPDNVGGWLYRASVNIVISRQRRAAVARRLAPRLIRLDGPAEPDAVAIAHEQHRDLERALSGLTESERVALLLAASGARGEEIAQTLGRSHGATRTLLCRARRHLRTAMTKATELALLEARGRESAASTC